MRHAFVLAGAACLANPAFSATTIQIDALFDLDVAWTCYITDCTGLNSVEPGDQALISFRLAVDETAPTFSASLAGPVGSVVRRRNGPPDGGMISVKPLLLAPRISDPALPSGGPNDVISVSWSNYTDHGDNTASESNGNIALFGDTNWFASNGGTFDIARFGQGVSGTMLESLNSEYIGGNLVLDEDIFGTPRGLTIRDVNRNTGSSASNPLLPINPVNPGNPQFIFSVPAAGLIAAKTPVWLDPDIALGYTYELLEGEVTQIHAPDFATVPDADGYLVEIAGQRYPLQTGGVLDLGLLGLSGVDMFTLLGIDPALALDPADPLAFALGIVPSGLDPNGLFQVVQTPITSAAVPLPASALLLLGALAGTALLRSRRR